MSRTCWVRLVISAGMARDFVKVLLRSIYYAGFDLRTPESLRKEGFLGCVMFCHFPKFTRSFSYQTGLFHSSWERLEQVNQLRHIVSICQSAVSPHDTEIQLKPLQNRFSIDACWAIATFRFLSLAIDFHGSGLAID